LPCSQQPASEQFPETEEPNPQFEKFCFTTIFMIIFPFKLRSTPFRFPDLFIHYGWTNISVPNVYAM